jgi:hypothetical protein
MRSRPGAQHQSAECSIASCVVLEPTKRPAAPQWATAATRSLQPPSCPLSERRRSGRPTHHLVWTAGPLVVSSARHRGARPRRGRSPACLCRIASGRWAGGGSPNGVWATTASTYRLFPGIDDIPAIKECISTRSLSRLKARMVYADEFRKSLYKDVS